MSRLGPINSVGSARAPMVFYQDSEARVRVLRLRYWPSIIALGVVLGVTFGGLALAESRWELEVVCLVTPAGVVIAAVLMAARSVRIASRTRLGRVELSDEGVQAQTCDAESLGGYVPWTNVGNVIRLEDWQRRRAGVQTVVLLPAGSVRWSRSGLRGDFGDAIIVVPWLRTHDAIELESAFKRLRVMESPPQGQA
jgi:hypothetical protein